jgi:hypothetical protein
MKSGLLSERIIYARIQSHKKENKPVITFETRTRAWQAEHFLIQE